MLLIALISMLLVKVLANVSRKPSTQTENGREMPELIGTNITVPNLKHMKKLRIGHSKKAISSCSCRPGTRQHGRGPRSTLALLITSFESKTRTSCEQETGFWHV